MATDPICKMNVSDADAKHTTINESKKFFFCSAACKQEFDKNPHKYTK